MTTNLIMSNDGMSAKQDYTEAVHHIEALEKAVLAKVNEIEDPAERDLHAGVEADPDQRGAGRTTQPRR